MQTANPELTAAALDNLMRFLLTGCRHMSQRAAVLLERLATEPGTDAELSAACQRLSERLQDEAVQVRAAASVRGYDGWRPEHV